MFTPRAPGPRWLPAALVLFLALFGTSLTCWRTSSAAPKSFMPLPPSEFES